MGLSNKIVYAGSLLATGILGFLTGRTTSVNELYSPQVPKEGIEDNMTVMRSDRNKGLEEELGTTTRTSNHDDNIESGRSDDKELRVRLERITPLILKSGNDVPLEVLERMAETGESHMDDNGTFYFNGREKIKRFVPGTSAMGLALTTSGQHTFPPELWDKAQGRKTVDYTSNGRDYQLVVFGTPYGRFLLTAFDKETGEVVGNTALRGSIENYDVKVVRDNEGNDVPLVTMLSLVNPIARMSPEDQRKVLGPKFSGFTTAIELAEQGIYGARGEDRQFVRDNEGRMVPYPNQYAQALSLFRADGDGIGDVTPGLEEQIDPNFEIPTPAGGVIRPRVIKTSVGTYIGPLNDGMDIGYLEIRGDDAHIELVRTGREIEGVYSEFAPFTGYGSRWNFDTTPSISGVSKVVNTPANPVLKIR